MVVRKVETFSDFTPDNDPRGEHDFGAFDHNGERIFWKVDYYNRTLTQGAPCAYSRSCSNPSTGRFFIRAG